MASAAVKKFQALTDDEKQAFKDGLNTYLGYLEEIKETRDGMKGQIEVTAGKIAGLNKKEVKKLFNYFKKGISPKALREDADIIEAVNKIRGVEEE